MKSKLRFLSSKRFFQLALSVLLIAIGSRLLAIGNGQQAVHGDYMNVVALVKKGDKETPSRAFCTGTVIHPRFVVTAAHCLIPRQDAQIGVFAGTVFDPRQAPSETARMYRVKRTFTYDLKGESGSDIGILELLDPADDLTPMKYAKNQKEFLDLLEQKTQTIVGFGRATVDGVSGVKRFGQAYVANVKDHMFSIFVGASMDPVNPFALPGDSGGPSLANSSTGEKVLMGVASKPDISRPAIAYSQFHKYLCWINAKTDAALEHGFNCQDSWQQFGSKPIGIDFTIQW